MTDVLSTCRQSRCLVGALVGVALLSTSVEAAEPADKVYRAVMAGIAKRVDLLESAEGRLEERYGYVGSKATVTAALADAKVTGNSRALAGRLYVLWRGVQPFFVAQRANLVGHAKALEAQGHVPPHDVKWLLGAYGELDGLVQALTRSLEDATALTVQRQQASALVAKAEANLQASRRAMRGARSRGVADLLAGAEAAVTEARARVAAVTATLMAHETTVRRDAARDVLPPYVAVTERPTRPLAQVLYTGHEIAIEAPGSAEEADSGARAAAKVAECQTRIDALAAERKALLAKAQVHLDAARKTEEALTAIRGPVDLPEVRALMTRRGELDARIKAKRQAIGTIDLDAPNGRAQAQKAAEEVLTLQGQIPALDAELTRLRSKAHLLGWRERTREAVAQELAAARAPRQEAKRIRRLESREQIKRLRIEGELADEVMQTHLAKATSLAQAIKVHPKLVQITVTRPTFGPGQQRGGGKRDAQGEDVLVVKRQTARALIEAVAGMQAARSALTQSVKTLNGAWEALSEARGLAEARPTKVVRAELEAVLAAAWKRSMTRLALKGSGGATGKTLRRAFEALPVGDEPVEAREDVPTGDLALSFERFESTMDSGATRKLLRKLVSRELRRFVPEAKAASPEVEAIARILEARARHPHLSLAWRAHQHARTEAERAGAAGRAIYEETDLRAGGRLTRGAPLRVGDPVSVILGHTGRKRFKCPAIRIGPHPIPLDGRPDRGVCRYGVDRLGALPDGDIALHIGSKP